MLDPKQYLDTIGSFATGVTVITTEHESQLRGMTATGVTSLSLSPMLIIVCIAKKAKIADVLQTGQSFSVSILREEQAVISNHFAGAIKKQEQEPEIRFARWEGGSRLEGCLAALGCRVAQIHEGGDHWIVVGEVLHLYHGVEPRQPLLYFRGRYGRLEPGGVLAPLRADLDEGTPQIYYDW